MRIISEQSVIVQRKSEVKLKRYKTLIVQRTPTAKITIIQAKKSGEIVILIEPP